MRERESIQEMKQVCAVKGFQLYSSKSLRCSSRSHSQKERGVGTLAGLSGWAEAVCRWGQIQSRSGVGSNPISPTKQMHDLERVNLSGLFCPSLLMSDWLWVDCMRKCR